MKNFTTLSKKIRFSMVIMVTVTVIVNLIVGIFISYKGLEDNVRKDLKSMGELSNVAITKSLSGMEQEVKSAASIAVPEVSSDKAAWLSQLSERKTAYGMKELYAADGSGNIISADQSLSGQNIANEEYFKKALQGKTYFSTTKKDLKGSLVIFLSTPLKSGSFSGVMVAELGSTTLSNIIRDVRVGTTGNVFIIDKEAKMIANMRPQLVEQQQNFITAAKTDKSYESAAQVYEKMTQGKTGTDIYAYETGDRICYYAPVSGTDGWSYGVVAPVKEMTSSIYSIILGMAAVSAALIAAGVFFSAKLASAIASPVKACSDRLAGLSGGDLHSPVPEVKAKDETGRLAEAAGALVRDMKNIIDDEKLVLGEMAGGNFNISANKSYYRGDFKPIYTSITHISDSLSGVCSEIGTVAGQVASGSGEVAGGAQSLASGAGEQAATIEQISATVAEISSKAESNAQGVDTANKEALQVSEKLEKSNAQMAELTEAMDKIRDYSGKISAIIKTIEDIAFQTNILALNAAVEAARAGEAGKGFAVVANEIRNLAGKSAAASKNTAELINGTSDAVAEGVKITGDTASSLGEVVEGEKRIMALFAKIALASGEQSDAVKEVTHGLEQVAAVVQTTSATSQESAAASEGLSAQAKRMKGLIASFRLKGQA